MRFAVLGGLLGGVMAQVGDPFTMELRCCDDEGMVTGEYLVQHHRLRRLGGHEPYTGPPFACTGSKHLMGEHIRCTSPAHVANLAKFAGSTLVAGMPLNGWQVTTTGDALPERPERNDEPLPEDLERLLRDPEIAIPQDLDVHRFLRAHLRRNPEATVTRAMYLNLWALIETGIFDAK